MTWAFKRHRWQRVRRALVGAGFFLITLGLD
jgi:hypothetical protein